MHARRITMAALATMCVTAAACSSSDGTTGVGQFRSQPGGQKGGVRASTGATVGALSTPPRSHGGSPTEFCAQARSVGLTNTTEALNPGGGDMDKVLAGIDSLQAVAPGTIAADFRVFDQFEHAILKPGSVPQPDGNSSRRALGHVTAYLERVCALG